MFYSNVGLVFVNKSPGESFNFYYNKAENIINKISINDAKPFFITPSQVENVYNMSSKETSISKMDCKYY
jgi:capsule polysaccharide modification protein KpsS